MTAIIFDIETVPDGRLIQKIHYEEDKDMSPADAIKRYQEKLLKDSDGKRDFIPHTYHVPVSVALIKVGKEGMIENLKTLDKGSFRPYEIVGEFWNIWQHYNKNEYLTTQLVTFNGRQFDLPVMELCAYRYGLSMKEWFIQDKPTYSQPRYRYTLKYHLDLMEFLTNFGTIHFEGGLNLAAILLGKPGKMQLKGSDVLKLWQDGKKQEIDNYCLCDTLDTYFIYLRVQVMMGHLSLSEEKIAVKEAKQFLKNKIEAYPTIEDYLANFTYWTEPNEDNQGFIE